MTVVIFQVNGRRTYLPVVENEWVDGKIKQKVLLRRGRTDVLRQSGQLDELMLSIQRFSEFVRFRRVLMRWEKKLENYLSRLHLVSVIITFRVTGLFG